MILFTITFDHVNHNTLFRRLCGLQRNAITALYEYFPFRSGLYLDHLANSFFSAVLLSSFILNTIDTIDTIILILTATDTLVGNVLSLPINVTTTNGCGHIGS